MNKFGLVVFLCIVSVTGSLFSVGIMLHINGALTEENTALKEQWRSNGAIITCDQLPDGTYENLSGDCVFVRNWTSGQIFRLKNAPPAHWERFDSLCGVFKEIAIIRLPNQATTKPNAVSAQG